MSPGRTHSARWQHHWIFSVLSLQRLKKNQDWKARVQKRSRLNGDSLWKKTLFLRADTFSNLFPASFHILIIGFLRNSLQVWILQFAVSPVGKSRHKLKHIVNNLKKCQDLSVVLTSCMKPLLLFTWKIQHRMVQMCFLVHLYLPFSFVYDTLTANSKAIATNTYG